jgi:hypothetical protein
MCVALSDQINQLRSAIRTKASVPPRFFEMPETELEAYYDAHIQELDQLTILNLVACTEAAITVDYFKRVKQRGRDSLAVEYIAMHQSLTGARQLRPDFDSILERLKDAHVMDNHIVGRYKECRRARHWIGHGRFWSQPPEMKLDLDEVYLRADALLQALPN